jgi:membrane associated rhomboid family serine protease
MPSENCTSRQHRPAGYDIFAVLLLVTTFSCIANSVEGFSSAKTSPRNLPLTIHPYTRTKSTYVSCKHAFSKPSGYLPRSNWSSKLTSTALKLSTDNHLTPAPSSSSSKTRATAVYALMLCNLAVFVMDKVFGWRFVARQLYFFHHRWKWWQPLTTCFCHADRFHLGNNLFLLLLFGRSVEDDQGWGGLLLSYVFCGVFASLVSLFLMSANTISIGASGAVFGLFAVSTLAKLSWRDFDWRKLVEVAVLGEFVFRQLANEVSTAAGGGRAGINHVAHLSGAAAGAILVFGMKATVATFDPNVNKKKNKKKNSKGKDDSSLLK